MNRHKAFTLIELLVVITIVAVLAAILFPVYAQAKVAAKRVSNLSNLRQITMAMQMYAADTGGYPMMSSPTTAVPRTRWPDAIYPYVRETAAFNGPLAPREMATKKFAHDQSITYGGYGYNYQYLGNSRSVAGDPNLPFAALDGQIDAASETIAVADTQGVRNDAGKLTAGDYTIDPPLTSARGSGKSSGFYGAGIECGSGVANTPGAWGCRSTPAHWAAKRVTVGWLDGHASVKPRSFLDDYNRDGALDNGFWNGFADPNRT